MTKSSPLCSAIIPAAGASTRMGASRSKCLLELDGKSLLHRVLEVLSTIDQIGPIVVMSPPEAEPEALEEFNQLASNFSQVFVTSGGATRQDSVRLGLNFLSSLPGPQAELVLVHDAARALVTRELVTRCIAEASERQAVTAAVRVIDTVKRVSSKGIVIESLKREELWMAQTPQVFSSSLLIKAHKRAEDEGIQATDDATLIEAIQPVFVVEGERSNIKITTPEDLVVAESYLAGLAA